MLKLSTLLLALLPLSATAQTAPPQLSPKAAFDQAMHPLDATRHSISNWSDTEIAALTVTMTNAHNACAARDVNTFSGSDLIDLARLCALGQTYPTTVQATSKYIAADAPKPELTAAYAILIDALLRLKDEHEALASTLKMLAAVPYDSVTAQTVDQAIDFMRFVYTPDALQLALARQPLLLDRIHTLATPATTPATQPASTDTAPQSLHELYADGIDLATLQQLSKLPADAAATLTALDAALPPSPASDDAIPITITRRRYALLGQPLPRLDHPAHPAQPKHLFPLITLDFPQSPRQIPAANAITALLLFPDWCAQCIRMAYKFPTTVFSVAGNEASLYGLLAETVTPNPAPTKPPTAPVPFTPADTVNNLSTTPTNVVDPSLLDQFAATAFPLLILTDTEGIVRVLQPVGDSAMEPGDTVDSAIARVGAQWPSPHLPKPTPPTAQPQTP